MRQRDALPRWLIIAANILAGLIIVIRVAVRVFVGV
jgi:hypothetical protein